MLAMKSSYESCAAVDFCAGTSLPASFGAWECMHTRRGRMSVAEANKKASTAARPHRARACELLAECLLWSRDSQPRRRATRAARTNWVGTLRWRGSGALTAETTVCSERLDS